MLGILKLVADTVVGCDLQALDSVQYDEKELKRQMKAQVDEALARGVFGAPYMFVDGEPFWGHDRLPQVERWLQMGPF